MVVIDANFVIVLFLQCLVGWPLLSTQSFCIQTFPSRHQQSKLTYSSLLFESSSSGDPVRAATGIRPSLHPVTINALADALRARARNVAEIPIRVNESVQPLEVAIAAGTIASSAIEKRQQTSDEDGMTLTVEEEQTIAGRVVGVVMRFDDLEQQLWSKCQAVGWVSKYAEWDSFGVLTDESDVDTRVLVLDERIASDPLFTMNRAECLLAIFLHTVEAPAMQKINQAVPGGSAVDFLDADRLEVLLAEQ
jgi:hypothetical protein